MVHRFSRLGLLLVVVIASLGMAPPARAALTDYDMPNGHFYPQAAATYGPAEYGFGYAITDDGVDSQGKPVKLWSEFKRLGGVEKLGYPASQRFLWAGFICQATQRVVLQWQPETGAVAFINVFDLASVAGKDAYLEAARQIPKPEQFNDIGKPFQQVVNERLALLNARPAIRAAYLSLGQFAIDLNGLPVAAIKDTGDAYVLRAQRVVFQEWKKDMPWAQAGQVTQALGGDIAKEAGLIQAQSLTAVIPVARPQGAADTTVSAAQLSPDPAIQGAVEEIIKFDRSTGAGVMAMLAQSGVKIGFVDTGDVNAYALYNPSTKTIRLSPGLSTQSKAAITAAISEMSMLSLVFVLELGLEPGEDCISTRARAFHYTLSVWGTLYPNGQTNPQHDLERGANSLYTVLGKGDAEFMQAVRTLISETCK